MNPQHFRLFFLIGCLAAVPAAQSQIQIEQVLGQPAMASEVLVKPRPGVSLNQLATAFDADLVRPAGNAGWVRVRSRSIGASTLVGAANANSLVSAAHPNYIIRAVETLPTDPSFGSLWALRNTGQAVSGRTGAPGADIGATKAWDITLGSRNNLVGVIDTGVDYRHPDLSENVWSAPAPYTITFGDSSYTCPAGSHGFNAVALTCDPLDDNNHGTHVAGIVGARGNNGLGVTGVNWKASIVAIKVLNLYGTASIADAINGIEAAVQMRAQGINIRVLSASWSSGNASEALEQAIVDTNLAGILFVAAAGNSASSNDGSVSTYPASYKQPNIVSVAATDNRDELASFSSFGANSVHLAAPGTDVLSTFIGGNYSTLSGTSMATPHVSGAAALILSRCTLNSAELKQLLLDSVDPLPALNGLTITGGRLNVYRALQQCGATAIPDFQLSANPPSFPIVPGESGSTIIGVQQFFGLTGSVTLSVSGLPAGVTATFSPRTLNGSGTSLLTFSVDPSAIRGNYPVIVTGKDGAGTNVNTVSLSLAIFAPDFALTPPAAGQLTSAAPINLPVTVVTAGGYNGTVQLSASGLPAGVTAVFTPSSVTGPGISILTLTANSLTPLGSTSITVQGVSGALLRTTSVAFTVLAPPDLLLTANPSMLSGAPGGPASTTITVEPVAKFEGIVSLSCPGLPTGFSCAFSPPTLATIGSSTLTITPASNVALGVYTIAVQASSGTLIRNTSVKLNVIALPSLALSLPALLDIGASSMVVVTLPTPAPATGLEVTLANSNPAAAGLTMTSFYIPPGLTSAARSRLSGLSAGLVKITALANGYGPGSATLQVGSALGTLSFIPSSITLAPATTQTLTVNLSPPAPAAGLVVALSSSNAAAATVPLVLNVPANANSIAVPLTALAGGSTALTATASAYTAATANVTVSAAPSTLAIATTSLAPGQAGQLYSQPLSATGGSKPYAWVVSNGTLPSGLTLNPTTGLLSGLPLTAANNLLLTFRVTDAGTPTQSATVTLGLTISATATGASISLPASLALATGAQATLVVQLSAPAPPKGVTLMLTNSNPASAGLNVDSLFIPGGQSSSSRARIAGISNGIAVISASGEGYASANVTVQVGSSTGTLAFAPASFGSSAPVTQNLTLILSPPAPAAGLTVLLTSSNPASVTVPASVSVPGNASSVAVAVTALAPGQSLISATTPSYAPASITLTVPGGPSLLTLTSTGLSTGEAGQAYAYTLTATGGTKPYSWSVTGTLPLGLTLNPITGVLSGLPQAAVASLPLLFRVTDASNPAQASVASLNLTIATAKPAGASIVLPSNFTLAPGADTPLIVRLSAPAPIGGLELSLSNDNPSTAAVNVTTLYIPAGQASSSRARVSGLSAGPARLTVTAPGYAGASVVVQVGAGSI